MAYANAGKAALRQATRAAIVASVTAPDAVASVGVPTKAEFDAAVAEANATKAQLNALLVALRAAGLVQAA